MNECLQGAVEKAESHLGRFDQHVESLGKRRGISVDPISQDDVEQFPEDSAVFFDELRSDADWNLPRKAERLWMLVEVATYIDQAAPMLQVIDETLVRSIQCGSERFG